MSLKFEIETWAAALQACEAEDWDGTIREFEKIADNSKILTNLGLIYASLGEHEAAIENFNNATALDGYLAIAYFQSGVSNFLLGRYQEALEEFEAAFEFLRGNESINYEQLGLKYQLYAAAVLFNKAITLLNLGDVGRGMELLQQASQNKATPEHDVIDDAIQDRGEGYSVFSIPVGVLYRPNQKKVDNVGARDYMGKAKLISTSADAANEFSLTRTRTQRLAPVETARERILATNLARSRSAVVTGRTSPDNALTPPKASAITRSASANAASATVATESVAVPIKPLALDRAKSLRKAQDPSPAVRPPATLKIDVPSERPPSPPSSYERERLPSILRPAPQASRLTDIYEGYLDTSDVPEPLPQRRAPRKETLPQMPTRANTHTESFVRKSSESERLGTFDFELKRIRVKLFFKDEARGMVVAPDISFTDFLESVCAKFNYEFGALRLKFEDEDGTRVSLRDEGDWEMAVETAKDVSGAAAMSTVGSSVGKPGEGKLMIWCEEDYD